MLELRDIDPPVHRDEEVLVRVPAAGLGDTPSRSVPLAVSASGAATATFFSPDTDMTTKGNKDRGVCMS